MGLAEPPPIVLQGSVRSGKTLGVIGISLSMGGHEITKVHPGSPASEEGLREGDVIKDYTDLEGRHDIDGPPDTKVALIIKRKGVDKPLVFILTRRAYQLIKDKAVQDFFRGKEKYEID